MNKIQYQITNEAVTCTMRPTNCDVSPLKLELKAYLQDISGKIDDVIKGLEDESRCFLSEFERIGGKFDEAEALAATFYLKCYLSSYTDKYEEISRSVRNLSLRRHGALIVIERKDPVRPMITPGVDIAANLTHSLLESIFIPGGPLHDGAVLIQFDKIASASNVLPLSEQAAGDKKLGTRHRAALGLSERSDALVIVVSEETGKTSFGLNGKLYPFSAKA